MTWGHAPDHAVRTRARRLLLAAVFATLLATVFAARAFTSFEDVRTKLLTTPAPAVSGQAVVHTAGHTKVEQIHPPFALILHIENTAADTSAFVVAADEAKVCAPVVAGRSSQRVDCLVSQDWTTGVDHVVTVTGPAAGWSLTYVEVATYDGGTNGGGVQFFVIPAAAPYTSPGIVWILGVWIGVALIALLPWPRQGPRAIVIAHACVAVVVGAALVAAVASPWWSPYRVVFSFGTFVMVLILLFSPSLWHAGRRTSMWAMSRMVIPRPVVLSLLVAVVVGGAYVLVMHARLRDFYAGNYSGMLMIEAHTFDRSPLMNGRPDVRQSLVLQPSGYDAQFYYFVAFDPFLRAFHDNPARYRLTMDAPPYRFGRVGFSLLTKIVSFDQWRFYPVAMVWLILLATGACALMLAMIASDAGASRAWGLLVLLIPGFWQSVQATLPEPIAAAFLVAGYWALLRRRWWIAGACFGASLLVRETGVICVLLLAAGVFLSGRRRDAMVVTVIALTPIVAWRLYVGSVLFSDWGWQAFFFNPHDLGVPLAGFVDLWTAVARGDYPPPLVQAAHWYPAVLIAATVSAVVAFVTSRTALTLAATIYGVIAISLNYASIWVHIGNGQRGTYEVFVLLALVSIPPARPSRPIRAATTAAWVLAGLYVFVFAFDADLIRGSIAALIW